MSEVSCIEVGDIEVAVTGNVEVAGNVDVADVKDEAVR